MMPPPGLQIYLWLHVTLTLWPPGPKNWLCHAFAPCTTCAGSDGIHRLLYKLNSITWFTVA